MQILSLVNLELRFHCFIGYCVFDSGPKHHLGAVHVVVHNILKRGDKSLFVDQEEVDMGICGHLNPHIPFDEVNLPSHFGKPMVLLPLTNVLFIFLKKDN